MLKPIPTWDEFTVPILRMQSDGIVRHLRELINDVSESVGLTSDQRSVLLASGHEVAANRIAWAVSYLTRVGAMERPMRAKYVITQFGRDFLSKHPERITEADLRAVAKPGDEWWINKGRSPDTGTKSMGPNTFQDQTTDPVELISIGIEQLNGDVKAQLIERLISREPAFFEQAVVKLLVAMGYGGSGGEASATRLVNDGGIDGVIDQDVLGLNKVYVQAKRYAIDNSVSRPDVQKFVGALSGKADHGVFITTGRFSPGAKEYAERDARARIILIDGTHLVNLMVEYRVGVQVKHSVEIVEIDEDFFE